MQGTIKLYFQVKGKAPKDSATWHILPPNMPLCHEHYIELKTL